MSLKGELLSIEKQLWTGSAEAYHRNLDDRCIVAFTEMGGVMDRDAVAGTVEGAARWRDLDIEIEGLLQPTADMAMLTYRAHALRSTADRGEEPYAARVSSGYVRRGSEWKMAFHQQTPLPEAE